VLKKIALIVVLILILVPLAIWLAIRGSLPRLDGELAVAGLDHSVSIERDGLGVPTLTAQSRTDLAYATGFVHGQDRFFQMDLSRRAAAGRLAELLGPGLVETDKKLRIHGFEQVAEQVIERLAPERRGVLDAYAAGVNAAMAAWPVRPPEYLLLRERPRAWTAVDSMLVVYAMFLDLNDSTGRKEIARAQLRAALPDEVVAFIDPPGTSWDAPIVGDAFEPVAIPGPGIFDLRSQPAAPPSDATARLELSFDGVAVGSNNWAVGGPATADGKAIIANDMHLGLRMPNVWYRARMIVKGDADANVDLTGLTLPGVPVLVAGSNGDVAWGYTNSYGDWTDVVIVDPDPTDATHYLTERGSEAYGARKELFYAAGEDEPLELLVRTTIWGPVIGEFDGHPIALAWTAQQPLAANLEHLSLERATNVEDALFIANTIGAPVQNFVVADTHGSIGWTLMGRVPIRSGGYDPSVPASWSERGIGWTGWRVSAEYPRVIDPVSARLWTANARAVDAATVDFAGNGGYDRGARAGQIRDALLAIGTASVADLARIQLDDRALFLARWRELLMGLLDDAAVAGDASRTAARASVESWSGHAAIDDVGYRIVRAFRLAVVATVFNSLTAPARAQFPDTHFEPTPQFEGSLWQLVTTQPAHLVDPRFDSWRDELLEALDGALAELEENCGTLAQCTWGQRNRLSMHHPIASAVPSLSEWLDMPAIELPGDGDMPRVQGPSFGASERFVVSPGDEAHGLFEMPGGQSGHPLSRFYRAGHEAWVKGEPLSFLPGPTAHTLKLEAP
jgi:penicillin amidase